MNARPSVYIGGLDLGRPHEFTALSVLERTEVVPPAQYAVRHLHRFPLGTTYTAIVDDNIYTNVMAQQNLIDAADAAARHMRHAAQFGVDTEEAASWRHAAEHIVIPFDDKLGVADA